MAEQRGTRGRHLYRGGNFKPQMYFYYTKRRAHMYLAPGGNTPCSATGREGEREGGMKERRKELFYLTTHSTHFIYGYMASDIW